LDCHLFTYFLFSELSHNATGRWKRYTCC